MLGALNDETQKVHKPHCVFLILNIFEENSSGFYLIILVFAYGLILSATRTSKINQKKIKRQVGWLISKILKN